MTNTPDSGYVVWRSFRMTLAELEELKQTAAAYGYALSSYVRLRVFGKREGLRIVRRPAEVIQALGHLLGELNKQGSNLNQIARAYNMGERDEIGLTAYMQKCRPVLDAVETLLSGKFRIVADDGADAPDGALPNAKTQDLREPDWAAPLEKTQAALKPAAPVIESVKAAPEQPESLSPTVQRGTASGRYAGLANGRQSSSGKDEDG